MNEKGQDFRGLSALLIVNKAERRETTPVNSSLFTGDHDSILGGGAWGGSSPYNQETKCEGKALEVTTALWKVEQLSRGIGTVSETRRTQH